MLWSVNAYHVQCAWHLLLNNHMISEQTVCMLGRIYTPPSLLLSPTSPSFLPSHLLSPSFPSLLPFLPYQAEAEDDVLTKKRSNHLQRKLANRKAQAKVDPHVEDQFLTGRLYGGYQFLCNSCCTITRDSRIRCMIWFPKPSFFFFWFLRLCGARGCLFW